MTKDREMLAKMEKAMEIIGEWMVADVLIHGPGPRGGYERRSAEIQRLRKELGEYLHPLDVSGNVPLDLS